MNEVRTPWFNVRQQPPVRSGWYEYRFHGDKSTMRVFWSQEERRWFTWSLPCDSWRGLLKVKP